MALLTILRYPDKRLATKAAPVAAVDDRIRRLAADMLETMYEAEGIGLAATQVDVHERVVVLDTSESRDQPRVLINPEIVARSDERQVGNEGCLSVPQIYDDVERSVQVTVRALDEHGKLFVWEADGLDAVCIQHELDHLEGTVFVDHLSALKRERIKVKLLKKAREDAAEAKRRLARM